ncbi:hypothetical protein EDD85DRAFT_430652 [Armillaria nabsnona]|nr:hypothetical protein EDD85DRAFT_430652 [Armillaria nabsnona]
MHTSSHRTAFTDSSNETLCPFLNRRFKAFVHVIPSLQCGSVPHSLYPLLPTITMSNTAPPNCVFFQDESEGEIRTMTLSACISALEAARETDSVSVVRLEHIKYTTNWLHKGILVELQEVDPDAASPRKAYALIDRDAEPAPPSKIYFSSLQSCSSKARDEVKLSRNKGSFTTSSDQYEVRRYIDLATHPLPFMQLLVLYCGWSQAQIQFVHCAMFLVRRIPLECCHITSSEGLV